MCHECCKELKGWSKSFTKLEVLLALLETILLFLCLGFLIFLIMHLLACATWQTKKDVHCDKTTLPLNIDGAPTNIDGATTNIDKQATEKNEGYTTLRPDIECTWEPSKKTKAATHYYEDRRGSAGTTQSMNQERHQNKSIALTSLQQEYHTTLSREDYQEFGDEEVLGKLAIDEQSDGEEANDEYRMAVLALVKLRPPVDVTFACTVTVVSDHWTLTAASCIEALEETDSLDNFVLMERYGALRRGRTHVIGDVQLHPLYQGRNRSYDVAALRSESTLRPSCAPLTLPRPLDYFLITVGERFSILGHGSYRTIEPMDWKRAVRAVPVYSLPGALCRASETDGDSGSGSESEVWAPRHLSRGRAEAHGAGGCGAAALCAGVRYARGSVCSYCAGTPLVRAGVLLGVMAESRACGVSCEPALYVSLATVTDWLDMVLHPDP